MNNNVYDILAERGFIKQVTAPEELAILVKNKKIAYYVGFDPTADSLHAGHLMAIMGMVHLQKCGHTPIAVVGGGTAMVGDPSGKTEMRKMLTREVIVENSLKIKKQLQRFLKFEGADAVFVDNYDWLGDLKYINFLRDIGKHFSVNRMLTFETYKIRLQRGLSFLEFNYQLLQSYDFLMLYRNYDCLLQLGGDDQWANIIAGADLIRRVDGKEAFGLTFPLLVTASGNKMGKTEKGALWLDPEKTSPYEYYQYWVNVDDSDVQKLLAFFTMLPMDEIEKVGDLYGSMLNAVKNVLAFEATKIAHGKLEAEKAHISSLAAFGNREIVNTLLPSSTIKRNVGKEIENSMPGISVKRYNIKSGIALFKLLVENDLVSSNSQARRLVEQGGVYINDERVGNYDILIDESKENDGAILIRVGKKKHFRIEIIG
jgi:tyrosyl-tRNA synthetase